MGKAIGMVEFQTVSTGMNGADTMIKTAEVDVIECATVCPGKYIVIISGEISAVKAAVDSAKSRFNEKVIDSFVLGNPHDSIFPAIYGPNQVEKVDALGILETYDVAALIVAADLAAKTALVDLLELRLAKGMCGKSYMTLTGSVSAVTAAIEKAKAESAGRGMFLDSAVIARPSDKLAKYIM